MEDMVITWFNIEDNNEIADEIIDEELENLDDVSAIDIDFYDDDGKEYDISLKDQKYTHIKAMEEMYVMRSYMTQMFFHLENFNSLGTLHFTAQQQRFK